MHRPRHPPTPNHTNLKVTTHNQSLFITPSRNSIALFYAGVLNMYLAGGHILPIEAAAKLNNLSLAKLY
jgi:hypothetical protein